MTELATLRQLAHATGHLLYMGFSPEVRLCSYGALQIDGEEWLQGDFAVAQVSVGQLGIESITITLGDVEHAWAQRIRAAFAPGMPQIECHWSLLYRGRHGWETDLRFAGGLDKPTIGNNGSVQIIARVATDHIGVAPRVPFESPYSLPRGSEVVVNGTTYRVED